MALPSSQIAATQVVMGTFHCWRTLPLFLLQPRQVRGLPVREFAYELLRPPGGFFNRALQLAVLVRKLAPVLVLRVGVLEHPRRAPPLFLQDGRDTLSRLGHMRDFIKMPGGLGVLDHHKPR